MKNESLLKANRKMKPIIYIGLIALFTLCCYFRFVKLATPHLWQDEAEYISYAATVNDHYTPRLTYKNVTLFNIEIFPEFLRENDPVYEYQPLKSLTGDTLTYYTWLPLYITGIGMEIFGQSVFVGRFISSLFGVLTSLLIGLIFFRHFSIFSGLVAFTCVALLSPFIHVSRMIQHNSFALFFMGASILFFFELMNCKSWKNISLLALALILTFHCHQVAFLLVALALALFYFYLYRIDLKGIVLILISVIGVLPWLLYTHFWEYQDYISLNYEPHISTIIDRTIELFDGQFLPLCLSVIAYFVSFSYVAFHQRNKKDLLILTLPVVFFICTDFFTPWNLRVEFRCIFFAFSLVLAIPLSFHKIKNKKLSLILYLFLLIPSLLLSYSEKVRLNTSLDRFTHGEHKDGFNSKWAGAVNEFLRENGLKEDDIVIADEPIVYLFQYNLRAYLPWAISSKKLINKNNSTIWIVENSYHRESCLETWKYEESRCAYKKYPYFIFTQVCPLSILPFDRENLKIWKCGKAELEKIRQILPTKPSSI